MRTTGSFPEKLEKAAIVVAIGFLCVIYIQERIPNRTQGYYRLALAYVQPKHIFPTGGRKLTELAENVLISCLKQRQKMDGPEKV